MTQPGFVVVTDRGGHLHDALRLLDQLKISPEALITTVGPDVAFLKKDPAFQNSKVLSVPQGFSWVGKRRLWNPFKLLYQGFLAFWFALRLRPKVVISTGASNVVLFCYFARLFGGKIYHIENLAQVVNPSLTGRMLYPICVALYVQWRELLPCYGAKARYEGWVL
jgi:UDP-N-acetylglucosamine:LPS N-acetylglucosamine transferase